MCSIEVDRSRKIDPEDTQAMAERQAQKQLTEEVHRRRDNIRRMRCLHQRIAGADSHRARAIVYYLTSADKLLYGEFCNGQMIMKLNAFTEQHGHGIDDAEYCDHNCIM